MTPEGKVKAKVKRILKAMKDANGGLYWHMPVQNGMGEPTLDFIGSNHGQFFAVETKAPGNEPTPRQWTTIEKMREAGGLVYVFDGTDEKDFIKWLSAMY